MPRHCRRTGSIVTELIVAWSIAAGPAENLPLDLHRRVLLAQPQQLTTLILKTARPEHCHWVQVARHDTIVQP